MEALKWESLSKEQQHRVEEQLESLKRGVVEIVPEEEFRDKLIRSVVTGEPLRIKLGLDPSAPDIHIGHTVVLHKLRQFQEFGHTVQLIIGDFTGRIGDPTGKSETRKQLSEEDVQHNAATYKEQIFKILDADRTEVYFNSSWLSPMTFSQVVELSAKLTVARMLERDDFTKRYQSGQPISIHEFFYPLMQGYDSVTLKSDVELGGTDQKFNLLMGRTLQKEYGTDAQIAMMLPLLEGLDGVQKMSKSLGNYIGIDEPPQEVYGKSMSIPDELMVKYYELVTDLSHAEVESIRSGLADGSAHPRDMKMRLAHTLVRMYHGEEAAEQAESHFKTVFQQGALPDDIEEKVLALSKLEDGQIKLIHLLVELGLQSSNGEARRSIQQGAVRINQDKLADPQAEVAVADGDIVQVGKRKYARIKLQ